MEYSECLLKSSPLPGMGGQYLEFTIHGTVVPRTGAIAYELKIQQIRPEGATSHCIMFPLGLLANFRQTVAEAIEKLKARGLLAAREGDNWQAACYITRERIGITSAIVRDRNSAEILLETHQENGGTSPRRKYKLLIITWGLDAAQNLIVNSPGIVLTVGSFPAFLECLEKLRRQSESLFDRATGNPTERRGTCS